MPPRSGKATARRSAPRAETEPRLRRGRTKTEAPPLAVRKRSPRRRRSRRATPGRDANATRREPPRRPPDTPAERRAPRRRWRARARRRDSSPTAPRRATVARRPSAPTPNPTPTPPRDRSPECTHARWSSSSTAESHPAAKAAGASGETGNTPPRPAGTPAHSCATRRRTRTAGSSRTAAAPAATWKKARGAR